MATRDSVRRNRALAACGLLVVWGSVFGQAAGLPDPTRPPTGFVDELPKGGASAGVPGDDGAVAARAAAPADRPAAGLQSVLIPRQGKPVAIIGGRYVPLGEHWEGWELVAVRETEVVLVRGKQKKVLRLTPGAEKRTAGAAKAGATTGVVAAKDQLRAHRDATGKASQSRKESETGR